MVEFIVSKRELSEKMSTLRKNGFIPGVVYGGEENLHIKVALNAFKKVLEDAGRSNLIQLNIEGKKILSLVKDFQLHPLTDEFIHFDILEVNESREIRVQVPLEFTGTAKGVKEGGVLEILQDRVEVASKAKDIPSFISIDVSSLEIGFSIHLKDVVAPANTRFTQDLSTVLVVVAGEVSKSEEESEEN